MRKILVGAVFCLQGLIAVPSQASERDWFVCAGAQQGDGSQERPFADPWQALERAEAGDRVLVSEGQYVGKLSSASWSLVFDRVQLVGGYNTQFTERDPWRHPSQLRWDPTSPNWPKESPVIGRGTDVVIDGMVIDMRDQNSYVDDAKSSRSSVSTTSALWFEKPSIVRNCVIINPGFKGIDCPPGSTIENNLVVNAICWGIDVRSNSGDFGRTPAIIERNTILFSWDIEKPGAGGYPGSAIALHGPATIRGNILAHSDNNAIFSMSDPGRVSLLDNVFFANLYSNLKSKTSDGAVAFNDDDMEMLEELELRECRDNVVLDPVIQIAERWHGMAATRKVETTEKAGAESIDDSFSPWGKSKKVEMAKGIAPAMLLEEALAFLDVGPGIEAGARRRAFDVDLRLSPTETQARTYRPVDLTSWSANPQSVDGEALEMIVARGSAANISGIPAQYDPKTIDGVFLFDSKGDQRITGFFKKGTQIERVCSELDGRYSSGNPDTLYLVRGVAHVASSFPKAAFLIEKIERFVAKTVTVSRPVGRDWFVMAGAKSGDGSREKPFRDPYQALEKCESGDVIHVSQGEYSGRLKAGRWVIDLPYITMLGGYDPEFRERDPWNRPSVLFCPAEFKGQRENYTVEGGEDHQGAVLDGFVFDRKLDNVYPTPMRVDPNQVNSKEPIWFSRPECVIRNCTFVNGGFGAIRASNGQVIENNVFVNHVVQVVRVERGHSNAPLVFQNNTVLFVWDSRPAMGQGRTGSLLDLADGDVQAEIRGNIFEFADNDAIRISTNPAKVTLEGNTFAHNLWSHVQYMPNWSTIDEKNFASLGDLGFAKCSDNAIKPSNLPIPQSWLDLYLRRTRMGTTKVELPAWDSLRTALGQPSVASLEASGEGIFAPAFDRAAAVAMATANASAKTGARRLSLPLQFTGVSRNEPAASEFKDVSWDSVVSPDAWDRLAGQRITIEVAIVGVLDRYALNGHDASNSVAFQARGPLGVDSGGMPLHGYVAKGTRLDRAVRKAKGFGTGRPEEIHMLRGTVQKNRQFVVESIELKS